MRSLSATIHTFYCFILFKSCIFSVGEASSYGTSILGNIKSSEFQVHTLIEKVSILTLNDCQKSFPASSERLELLPQEWRPRFTFNTQEKEGQRGITVLYFRFVVVVVGNFHKGEIFLVHQQPCAVPSNAPCSFFLLLMLLVLYFLVQQQPCADVLSLNYSWRLRPLLTKICWLFGLLSFDRNQLQC